MKGVFNRALSRWRDSTFRLYIKTLVKIMSWRVALALVLTILRSTTQGAQLLLLVPLMQLVGLDVQQGSIGWLADLVSYMFSAVGVQPTLPVVLGAFLLFTILLALITRWQETFNFKLQQDFVADLRKKLYRAITNTSWLSFARSRPSDFTHALTTEMNRVGAATSFLLTMVTNAFLVSVYALFALRLSPIMSTLVFVSGAVLLLLLWGKTRKARWSGEDITLVTNGLYSATNEHLNGMKTVKSYGVEKRNVDIFSNLASRVAQMELGAVRNYAETRFWFNVGSAVILSGILFVAFGIMSVPAASLLLLLFLFNRMIPLFNSLQQNFQQYLNALPAFAGIMRLMSRCEEDAEPRVERLEKIELRDGIRFEDVSFAYGEGENATIRDLDLTIGAGKTSAIVGPSGAGKSTVADLVTGLISPEQGRVLVDELPLEAERISSWRAQIGYVTQDTFLFNDTVRANLLWAHPEATEDEMTHALNLAAGEFVERLPYGKETVLGDRGVRLSGGEKQRLALARALLRRPSLLILDEATSSLDSENEQRIQEAIENLHGETTILIITHRLSTIKNADVIHVIEDGELVESGSWGELSLADSRLESLRRSQALA